MVTRSDGMAAPSTTRASPRYWRRAAMAGVAEPAAARDSTRIFSRSWSSTGNKMDMGVPSSAARAGARKPEGGSAPPAVSWGKGRGHKSDDAGDDQVRRTLVIRKYEGSTCAQEWKRKAPVTC